MQFAPQKGMSVAANFARIKRVLTETQGSASVKIIAVTKTIGPAQLQEAIDCGITEFGENRVLDALKKQDAMPPEVTDKVSWHLIGHLQTNKVKKVIGRFALIHSVDSLRLAEEISIEAQKQGLQQPILLQVKIMDDPSKSGFQPEQLKQLMPTLLQLPGVRIDGLMTIAPYTSDAEVWKQSFCGLKSLQDELQKTFGVPLKELSMGMSQDWKEAVACGATMIRLGRAIFGDRAA